MSELMDEIREAQPLIWEWIASGKLETWSNSQFPHYSFRRWAELLGYKDVVEMVRHHKPEHIQLVRSIRGPHGFALYKALEVRSKW